MGSNHLHKPPLGFNLMFVHVYIMFDKFINASLILLHLGTEYVQQEQHNTKRTE